MKSLLKSYRADVIEPTSGTLVGDGVEMFSSGSAPTLMGDMFGGAETQLFSSGSAPSLSAGSLTGEGTEMFSSGSAPQRSDVMSGELV